MFSDLYNSILQGGGKTAFFIQGQLYTYKQLWEEVNALRQLVRTKMPPFQKGAVVIANDDLQTYASIYALWLEGYYYVAINPDNPPERNLQIITQSGAAFILDSKRAFVFSAMEVIDTRYPGIAVEDRAPVDPGDAEIAYIMFTSGTTGLPKGVPISRKNLKAFVLAFEQLCPDVNSNDRILQMFELTFDLSVMSFLIPTLKGAACYTVGRDAVKYSMIYELLDDHQITVALLVPSILNYLRPYFDEINCPKLRLSLFCGEALPADVAREWRACVSSARILNVYGPTEHTIFCSWYEVPNEGAKSYNGMLSIGKPMEGTSIVLKGEDGTLVTAGTYGELCLAGEQLTEGYLNNAEKNTEAFFISPADGRRYYRSGDLCFLNEEGDLMYAGRLDQQVKIQGYRVELAEIEYAAKTVLVDRNVLALALPNAAGNTEIWLVVEGTECDFDVLKRSLKEILPDYMLPAHYKEFGAFPLNTNGKTDRKKVAAAF